MRSNPFDFDGPRTAGECWLLTAGGEARVLYGDVALTNGIGLSPDGTVLYHSDTTPRRVGPRLRRWRGERPSIVHAGDDLQPDGSAVDEDGAVWVADVSGSSAVRGFAADGSEVDRIVVPASMVTSVCFGGADRRDMYIVTGGIATNSTRGSIYRHRGSTTPGCAVARATV